MYQRFQANTHLMNMLKEHIQTNSTFTHKDKVYNLLIEDLNMSSECLTLNHKHEKIEFYLCEDDCNAINIAVCEEFDKEYYLYEQDVICPSNDTESKKFISDLFNIFLVNILNNKHIKSIDADDNEDKIIFF